MSLTRFRRFPNRATALAVLLPTLLVANTAMAEFHGGGVAYGFNNCEAHGFDSAFVMPVRVRHRPGEEYDGSSTVTIFHASGGAHSITVNNTMIPRGRTRLRGRGQSIGEYLFSWATRPRLRINDQRIVFPEGETDITNAQSIVIRFRVWNFTGLPGCSVTIGAALNRN